MPRAPIELTLYDSDNEPVKTLSRIVVPWGILKKAVRLNKRIGGISVDALDEEAIDEIADLVITVFGQDKVSRAELDEYADTNDMMTVMESLVNRGVGLIPNAPPAAK